MKHTWKLAVLLVLLVALAACGGGQTAAPAAQATTAPAAKPNDAPKPAAQATTAPAAQATAAPAAKSGGTGAKIKVGLVTDQGGVNDKSFNQSAWAGVQRAIKELGVEGKFIESKAETDYEKNLDIFASEKYDVILGVGFLMGDALAKKAKQYPDRTFAIVDNAYFPAKAGDPDPYTTDLKNVTSLMFQEDEVGYLAGVLAGCMTKTSTVCTVSGMEIPPVVRYVVGFQNGAKSQNAQIKALNTYIPSFVDSAKGKETGLAMIGQGCDVVFGVGGITGNGGLLAAQENSKMAIGVDVDQYQTYPEVKAALVTSAMKNVDVAVFEAVKSAQAGQLKAGILTFNVKNGGIGLAPYHDWDAKIDQKCKDAVAKATDSLKSGAIQTGYKP